MAMEVKESNQGDVEVGLDGYTYFKRKETSSRVTSQCILSDPPMLCPSEMISDSEYSNPIIITKHVHGPDEKYCKKPKPAGSTKQESQNRKLLEQLEVEKKRLRGGGGSVPSAPSTSAVSGNRSILPGAGPAPTTGPPPPPAISTLPPDAAGMTSQQRTALQHAQKYSEGYFITQDSSFGNLILPVLPRYADK